MTDENVGQQPHTIVWTGEDNGNIYNPQIEITQFGGISISARGRGVCLTPEQWVNIGWSYVDNTLPIAPDSGLWQRLKTAWKIIVNRP